MFKKIALALIVAAAGFGPAHAGKTFDELETEAINHGYNTAALVTCGDRLIVTNTKLRAKLDKMYRDDPKWKKAYLEGFESGSPPDGPSKTKATEARNRVIVCTIAGNSEAGWLKLDETRSLEDEELYRH
jgi:hypothetical protein